MRHTHTEAERLIEREREREREGGVIRADEFGRFCFVLFFLLLKTG